MASTNISIAVQSSADENDPDNYFKIPELNLSPADVDFQGFSDPIVHGASGERIQTHRQIRALVRRVRSRIRAQFGTLADLQEAKRLLLEKTELNEPPSYSETSAYVYFEIMERLHVAASRTASDAAWLLGSCAMWVDWWWEQKTKAVSERAQRAAKKGQEPARNRREAIQRDWASGKYTSRQQCAELRCAAYNMAFDTARRALRNTPDPTKPQHK
jgi:hypothetical protein